MLRRNLEPSIVAALADTPAVFVAGPRQAGKSTLARAIAGDRRRYLTLDDATTFAAAGADPQGFVEALDDDVVIDEVQRVPELFRALKLAIDRDRRPGRFLLTGSADPLLAPSLSESLAGRVEWHTLWPFTQGEIDGVRDGLVDRLFADRLAPAGSAPATSRAELLRRAVAGGYPDAVARTDERRRREWLGAYLSALLQRDVRELAQVEGLAAFPRLLALVAARSGSSLNAAAIGRDAGLPYATLRRYLSLLEALHIVRTVPAWSTNATTRLVKAPRLMLTDSGLLAHLLGATVERLAADPALAGPLVEAFVGMELVKQTGWSRTRATLATFRTQIGREVDFVLEDDAGRLVGVEVKTASAVADADFAGLRQLAALAGRRFLRGVVLYAGRESRPFGERLLAMPIAELWRAPAAARSGRRAP